MPNNSEEKTIRIGIVCATVVVLGIIYSMAKNGSCNNNNTPSCHDEFHEFSGGRVSSVSCEQGAVAEVINSPPAPKAGILCHCPPRSLVVPAPSASSQP